MLCEALTTPRPRRQVGVHSKTPGCRNSPTRRKTRNLSTSAASALQFRLKAARSLNPKTSMKTKTFVSTFPFPAFTVIYLLAGSLCAQPPPLPEPTIAPAQSVESGPSAKMTFVGQPSFEMQSRKGRFLLAGLRPHETVDIQLQFSTRWANKSIVVQALDGGNLSTQPGNSVIAADATVSFRFQAGDQSGLYRVLVIGGGGSSTLKFWVPDPANPKANPPVVNSHS